MDAQSVFSEVCKLLQKDLMPVTYDAWFKDMKAVDLLTEGDGQVLVLSSDNPLAKDLVASKFADKIQNCLSILDYRNMTFRVIGPGETVSPTTPSETRNLAFEQALARAGLNSKFTFESFVEGGHNRLAYHSCLAVADFPGTTYNPLFIWGASGLGKTHLLHAIGRHVLQNDPEKSVLYVPSETFMNELIHSMGPGSEAFREKYRKIDVLLIDDIQFLSKKEATQDEFFHTFNTLYNNNKQIVICSDRPPENIEHLAERIRSRFKWGLTVDIQSPDYETRVAILMKKAEQNHMDVDMEVLYFIADHISSNIRDLEGALTRVDAYCRLLSPNTRITIDIATKALKDFSGMENKNTISCHRIIEAVCEHYEISRDDILSKKKPQNIAYPRQVAMYLCRKLTTDSLDSIGVALGGRDHSTIMYGADKISEEIKNIHNIHHDTLLRSLNDIERRLTGE